MPPNLDRPSCAPWGAHSGGSYLSVAFGFLAILGPRPSFIFSTRRRETAWLPWTEKNHHHGLARFPVARDGMIGDEPIKAIPRKKPCRVSTRQWERA
jgi:hypothetical protein